MERILCFNIRSVRMKISTSNMNGEMSILEINRPFNCKGFFNPCYLQNMEICSPPGQLLATVKEMYGILNFLILQ